MRDPGERSPHRQLWGAELAPGRAGGLQPEGGDTAQCRELGFAPRAVVGAEELGFWLRVGSGVQG